MGWRDIPTVFVVAAGVDSVYQINVLRFFHPRQALVVACGLAFVPHVAIRVS
jgi:hypothetical protein